MLIMKVYDVVYVCFGVFDFDKMEDYFIMFGMFWLDWMDDVFYMCGIGLDFVFYIIECGDFLFWGVVFMVGSKDDLV